MRASLRVALACAILAVSLPVHAQDPAAPDAPNRERRERKPRPTRDLSPEERAARAERWRSMPPEERARLRQLFEGHLRGRSAEDVERLRTKLDERLPREREATAERRREFEGRGREEKLRYQRLMRSLLHSLTPEERRRLADLEPEARKAELRRMVEGHREQVVDRRVRHLPGRVSASLKEELQGLPPRERLERVRQAVEAHVVERARAIQSDRGLTAEERGRRMNELLERFGKDERVRERLRRRIAGREGEDRPRPQGGERRRDGNGGGDRPGTGSEGDRPAGPDGGRRPGRRPRR